MHEFVDLRSDTVTRPTAAMRQAMAAAEVGDDVLGDDPTVERLQDRAAGLMGKEAAIFVPSGTMSNTIAIKAHTAPGDEVLMDWDAHSMRYEVGGAAVIAGVLTRQYRSVGGVPDPAEIASAIQGASLHNPRTALILLENTHNVSGGAVIPLDVHQTVYTAAQERGVRVHIDGARIFNAAVASSIPAREYAACADSITFCLSKGLCCPVGSVLCGTAAFIEQARRVRKMLGGGMRQVGVLAACGLVALDTMVERLAEDHANARRLAEGIAQTAGFEVDLATVQTNMVYFGTTSPAGPIVPALAKRGVRCLPVGANRIRMVTHHDVDAEDIERAIAAVREVSG